MDTQIDTLLSMVQFFVNSDDNKCWPTASRWTVKEAKQALKSQLERAKSENARNNATAEANGGPE